MTKHIILWTLKSDFTDAEKSALKAQAKQKLEALAGRIDGLLHIEVITGALASSNADMMLYSEFTGESALADYQTHPEHVAAAAFVRSIVSKRVCMDYNE